MFKCKISYIVCTLLRNVYYVFSLWTQLLLRVCDAPSAGSLSHTTHTHTTHSLTHSHTLTLTHTHTLSLSLTYTHTRTHTTHTTHTRTCTHTHTHTHVGFYGLWGLSIGVMVFILYKLYVLLPYTYPTPKLSPHRRRCISTFPQKNTHCMIYKLWGHWKCPHKSPSPCNTYVIPMSLYKFVSS